MPWSLPKYFKPNTGWETPRYEVFTWPVLTGVKPAFPETPSIEISDEIARAAEEASLRAVIAIAIAEQAHRYDPAWLGVWDRVKDDYIHRLRQSEIAARPRKRRGGPLKRTLENLSRYEGIRGIDALLAVFRADATALRKAELGIPTDNILGDLRDAGMAFIKVQEVDERHSRVYLSLADSSELRPVSFKRLANLLAEIRRIPE